MRPIKFRLVIGKDVSVPVTLNQMIMAFSLTNRKLPEEGNVIINQYTGMKDKNGKEIYEGDICTDGKHKSAIKWEHSRWMFWVEDCMECYNDAVGLEVIGNIYNNPELLK